MPSSGHRKRLKDRIIESVSKAVKQIQRLHGKDEEGITLSNDDWQFQKLVEHLDHALLHGLKHITNGYWVLVKEFTPKTTVKEIDRLASVTTNLGRGRAWLYLALSDHLFESYLNCYINNQARVKKFYMKEALVLDQDQMQVLLTISMGLEFVTFQLEVDKPYLDLASHVRLRTSSINEDDDSGSERLSLASMSSQISLSSCNTPEIAIDATSFQGDIETTSNESSEVDSIPVTSQGTLKHECYSIPVIQGGTPPSRFDRISSIPISNGPDIDLNKQRSPSSDDIQSLEVIRHKVKVPKSRKKGKTKKADSESLSSVDIERGSNVVHMVIDEDLETPESGYKSGLGHSSSKDLGNEQLDQSDFDIKKDGQNLIVKSQNAQSSSGDDQSVSEMYTSNTKLLDMNDSVTYSDDSGTASHMSVDCSSSQRVRTSDIDHSSGNESATETSESANCTGDTEPEYCKNEAKDCVDSNEYSFKKSSLAEDSDITSVNDDSTNDIAQKKDDLESSFNCVYDSLHKSVEDELSGESTVTLSPDKNAPKHPRNVLSRSLKSPINDNPNQPDTKAKSSKTKLKTSQFNEDSVKERGKNPGKDPEGNAVMQTLCPWDLKVDNNTKLILMLEVFQSEDEYFQKMFSTCLGHTEGDIQPILLILTDKAVYITTKTSKSKFRKEAIINFEEIDYISLSVGYQVLNIVCTNRRKQFWITTGDALLTKCIMGHLDNAIRHSERDIPRLSILTDATNQRIALQKWAAAECKCTKTEVSLLHYSLVYWEDVETNDAVAGWLTVGPSKQGTLQYYSHDAYYGFGVPVWKTGYFILREGTLYMHREKHDKGLPLLTVNLNLEECGGCRMNRDAERANCLEVLLTDGRSLLLAASNLTECQEWLQSLCQAVSHQMGMMSGRGVLVPCCCVLTSTRLFMCHEDVQTGFLRTLGAQNVMDITYVQLDPALQHVCIIRFDAPNAHEPEQWIVYFNCTQGRDNFLQSLEEAWFAVFQTKLPQAEIGKTSIQKKCKDGLRKIRQQRAL